MSTHLPKYLDSMEKNAQKRNNINLLGKGQQPMIFAHGFGCDQNMWRFVTPAFEDTHRIVLMDHVGSGHSDHAAYDFEKYNSLTGYAQDLIEVCEELQLQDVIVVAHSVSCMIAVLAAAARPELFDKLILIGPSPCYINDQDYFGGFDPKDIEELVATLESNYLGWSSYITPVIIGNPEKPEFSEELNRSFCTMNPEIAKHFAKVTFGGDNRADLAKVRTDSLIIQCHPDVIAPVEVGQFVHKNIRNSSFVQLNTSGHCPHLTAPELVISSIKNYLYA
jgi:sigma-B regulation protein RsbQ